MDDSEQPVAEPANLRFLRQLVTVLTAVMIGGVVIVIALLVMRLSQDPVQWPDEIALPEGAKARAVTRGDGWIGIVTMDGRLLIYDPLTGGLDLEVTLSQDGPGQPPEF